jgi:hypothetical protein
MRVGKLLHCGRCSCGLGLAPKRVGGARDATVTIVLHPAGREAERSELKRAFCSSLSEL